LREIVEPGVAGLAAVRAEPDDLARLKDLVERIEEAFVRGDSTANTEADVAFHDALAIATHNGIIIAISAGLHKAMHTSMLAQALVHIEEGARSHRTVYDAIVARDPVRAREAMEFHMTTTRRSQLSLTGG
jgi:DNA-binding FadR family transcriptional regulator